MSQAGSWIVGGGGGGGGSVKTVQGNTGGKVGPDGTGNINFIGSAPISVDGNGGTNTETISVSSATTAATGVVQLATDGQTLAGVNTTNAVTPSNLSAKLGTQTLDGVAYGTGSTTALGYTAAGTNGQLLIGSTAAAPVFGNLTSTGGTIAFTPGAGTLNLEVVAVGLMWTEIVGASATMAVNSGYIANNAGLVTLTLPAVVAQGSIIRVAGKGAGGWQIAQAAGQTIFFGSTTTTTGVAGFLSSTNRRDCIELLCITANTEFDVLSAQGNITFS